MSYNPFILILIDDKLTRSNYIDQKRNLDIVLIIKQLKWVTQEIVPPIPMSFPRRDRKMLIPSDKQKMRRFVVSYLGLSVM